MQLNKKIFEIIGNVSRPTIVFFFPGLGIGNIYDDLSGCTLQTNQFEVLSKNNPNINFIGISNQKIPNNNRYIKYIQISQKQSIDFDTIKKENKYYLQRVSYFIDKNNIIKYKNDDTYNHIDFINKCTGGII
jgi:peroxiredoxin